MAQGARQSSLFAAEDFSVVYESFSQANFQAYDFDTIRNAMVDYINNNYPESFNDWINSSEFVSLIELMSFLGHNLAFRADLATRENYLSTLERRESALRIAEFLGYTPTRNIVASGYLKLDSIRTNEPIYDVNGTDLANVSVQFEDVNDPDTYQNFLTVMNAIFQSSSQFGSPYSRFKRNNILNEIYRTKSIDNDVAYSFSNTVNGTRASFSLHSLYYNQSLSRIEEKTPNPYSTIDILYRNDNSGISSPNTGFFIGFKQGTLQYKDFVVENGLPNMVFDINESNVSNGNIWIQTIDETGQVLKNWTSVDRLFGHNAVFNAVNNNERDIFTVSSRENDQVSIVFGDGNFGNIPNGIIRVWYRTGLNQTYSINPTTFGQVNYTFNYTGKDGNTYRATATCSLKTTVNNASRRESIDSIKANAGRFFATQDRMVTADDYSLYPLTASENIRKIKSINRVHSGHSRFRDFHDPTATYSDASMYTDDMYLFKNDETTRNLVSLPTSFNAEQLYQRFIKPIFADPEVKNFYYHRHFYSSTAALFGFDGVTQYTDTNHGLTYYTEDGSFIDTYRWNQISKGNNNCTGYITYNEYVQRLGKSSVIPTRKMEVNSLVEFVTAPYKSGYIYNIEILNGGSGYTVEPTVTIAGTGQDAELQANIQDGKVVSVTVLNSGMNYNAATNISFTSNCLGTGAIARVYVRDAESTWARIVNLHSNGLGEDDAAGNPTGSDPTGRGAVVLSKIIPSGARVKRIVPSWETDLYTSIKTDVLTKLANRNSFGLRYDADSQKWEIVESEDLPNNTILSNSVDSWSRLYEGDSNSTGRDNSWIIRVNYSTDYWEILTRKTKFVIGSEEKIKFTNLNFQETFSSNTLKPKRDNIEFLNINTKGSYDFTPLGRNYKFNVVGYFIQPDGFTDQRKIRVAMADPDNDLYPDNPASFHETTNNESLRLLVQNVNGELQTTLDPFNGNIEKVGRSKLHSKYSRISDINQVIDPATTNIIDTYVLLNSYETQFRTWALYDGRSFTRPTAPTVSELNTLFERIENKKSISDQIIYRPVKFKLLFGDLASGELQARFNVTKTANATMSDNEIKQSIIALINDYFDIDNWDFGETFYFTELAAYIHNNMIGQVAQVTIKPVANDIDSQRLYEIRNDSDEMFMPVLDTSNIVVTNSILYNPTSIAANTGVSLQ